MSLFGKYRGEPAAGLATVAAFFLVFLLGGCGAPTPKCREVAYRTVSGIFTLGASELFVDCSYDALAGGSFAKSQLSPYTYGERLAMAKKGDREAQFEVAIRTSDPDEGWMWMCRSAMQGQPSAQRKIANWYDSNVEDLYWKVPIQRPDNVKALVWYSLAVSNGHPDYLKERDRAAASLSPDQVAEAERLVAEWKPDPAWCEKAAGDAMAAEPH